jgi:hypothetical protein
MSKHLVPAEQLRDFELPDDSGISHRLSELQGDDLMVLMLGRGEHCPRERQHQRAMVESYGWCAVAFTQLVTVLPNDERDANKMRIGVGAYWPYPCDSDYEVQTRLDIREYTDPHHRATVPHTLVVDPELATDKVYVGYWFWGRPAPYQLWMDLQDLTRRTKADYDPTLPEVKTAWEHQQTATGGS